MGLLKNFFSQTGKPEGFLGKLMVNGMNSGHAKLGDWGMERLPSKEVKNAADLGCGGGRNVQKLGKNTKTPLSSAPIIQSFPLKSPADITLP